MRPIPTLLTAVLLTAVTTFACVAPAAAESFTFRGQLDDGPHQAAGDYALRLTLYSHEGSTVPLAGPLELLDVAVNDGRFAVGVDFGSLPAHLEEGWLEVAVKSQNEPGDYLPLAGRRRVELKASQVCPASWTLVGNALTNPATNFLGTTDAQPLELRSNNQRVARFESVPLSIGHTANVLLGSPANLIDAGVRGATISGGGTPSGDSDPSFGSESPNRVTDAYGTVGGGYANQAGDGAGTTIDASVATVGGGFANTASNRNSTVGGGRENIASGVRSTVGGGYLNIASGSHSGVVGGEGNVADGDFSTVGGGVNNTALGYRSTVVGGNENCAGGSYSWAGGDRAKVRVSSGAGADPVGAGCDNVTATDGDGDQGTFIWSDAQAAPFESSGPNQFSIRASGGVRLNDDTRQFFGATTRQMLNLYNETYGIGVQGSTLYFRSNTQFAWFTDGVHSDTMGDPGTGGAVRMRLDSGGNLFTSGAVNPPSDRNLKTAFEPVDPLDMLARVLQLPLSEWSFKSSTEQRHIGPMAQDFHAAFGLNGSDDTHIATVDADGVALAAIQGLNAKLEAEIAAMREEMRALRAQVAAMQTRSER